MYFRAFDPGRKVDLPLELLFTIQYLTCQILLSANPEFLRTALREGHLAQELYEELEFFGQVPKSELQKAKAYLAAQEKTLAKTVKLLLKEPHNVDLRKQLGEPHSLPQHIP